MAARVWDGPGRTGAGVALAVTMPFMTTLLPSMLGAAIRHRRPQS